MVELRARKQRVGVGAHGVERDVAEVEQPAKPTTMFNPSASRM